MSDPNVSDPDTTTTEVTPSRRRALVGALGLIGGASIALASSNPASAAPAETPLDWVDVTEHGVTGDGSTDDAPALADLVADATANTWYVPAGQYRLAADLTLSSTLTLVIDRDAVFLPDDGCTLRFDADLHAGAQRVFGGEGRTIGTFGTRQARPEWFGASPTSIGQDADALADTGHDDARPIRDTIDALHAAGGGAVLLASGVYVLRSVAGRYKSLIIPRSNVDIVGQGESSVLKLADGLTAVHTPSFNVIFSEDKTEANRVDNATYRNFRVDGNGVANLQPDVTGVKNKCAAIGISLGSHITVDHVSVVQNPGQQTFLFGSNRKPQTVTDVRLTNCHVDTVGPTVDGNVHTTDHSVVYAQVDGFHMAGNLFVQPHKEKACTGIELHCAHAVITGNVIKSFDKAINIVATVTDMNDVVVSDNVFTDINCAAFVYCFPDMVMRNVRIVDNLFTQTAYGYYSYVPYGFFEASVKVKAPVDDLTIENNTFRCEMPVSDENMPAIRSGAVRHLTVRGNTFRGMTGPALTLSAVLDGQSRVTFEGNQVVDCGRTATAASRVGVDLTDDKQLKAAVVRLNSFVREDPDAMTTGMIGPSDVVNGVSESNLFEGLDTDLTWPSGATAMSIDYRGTDNPDGAPGKFGSRWINVAQHRSWTALGLGSTETDWRRDRP